MLKKRLQAIIPTVDIDARVSMFRREDADSLLDIAGVGVPPEVCFVLDCIDDLATKAELIAQCSKKGLRVLSSMGAGLKSDPTRLHIAKLADCCKDKLAMRVSTCVRASERVSGLPRLSLFPAFVFFVVGVVNLATPGGFFLFP